MNTPSKTIMRVSLSQWCVPGFFIGLLIVSLALLGGCAMSTSTPTADGPPPGSPSATSERSARPTDKRDVTNPPPRAMEGAASAGSPFVGRVAPSFELRNDRGEAVDLASFRGSWLVLYFYPRDDTPGCTCQATEFTDLLRRFHDLGAQVVGVSPDSPRSHQFFRDKYDLKITLLSDEDHEVMRRYGAWADYEVDEVGQGRVIRSTFLIDPQGRIAWHWPEVIPTGHASRVREKLQELQAVLDATRESASGDPVNPSKSS